jgi:hypothetical protein
VAGTLGGLQSVASSARRLFAINGNGSPGSFVLRRWGWIISGRVSRH